MKKAWIIVLFLVFPAPVVAAGGSSTVKDRGGANIAEMRLLLNSFAALGEGHIENVLNGLKLLSVTDEVRSGKWTRMKPLLAQFARGGIKAAAVWFGRPDGSYFTVEKDLTGLSLLDRGFFRRLMAGGEVAGDLVLSKSTGKRVAIVAVPVRKEDGIIGVLGASLSVEQISGMIDEKMGLPGNIVFYALDRKGQASLHRMSALIFGYPSDMGSKSLAKTVLVMLTRPEGSVTYDFYGERSVVFRRFPLTGWVYAIGIITGRPGPVEELPPILDEFEKEITAEFNKMDRDLAKVAGQLSEKGLKTPGAREMLAGLCRPYPYAADCSVVDRNGKMVLVEPGAYAEFEGSDISAQEQMVRLRESGKPVMSNVFKSVEGFDAAGLEYPIFSPQGKFEGSVSLLFRPESLFSHVLAPVLRGMPVEAFAMQTDGRILYDEDKKEVGRMLFTDPAYKPFPQLLALGSVISREKKGAGSYDYRRKGSEKVVKKDVHWTTVGLYGTQWRLVVMHIRPGQLHTVKYVKRPLSGPDNVALRALAESRELRDALAGNDIARIKGLLRDFYHRHEGLYSVQWIDAGGTNLYGYPEENSLIGVDMKTAKTPSAKPMLRALSGKKEGSFDCPLMEGETGAFFMVPVFDGKDYLGMIYTIRIKKPGEH